MSTRLWFEELPGELLHRIVHYVVPSTLRLEQIERLLLRIRAMLPLLKERHALLRVTEAAVTLMMKNVRNLEVAPDDVCPNFFQSTRRVCALLEGRATDGICIESMTLRIDCPALVPEAVRVFNKVHAREEKLMVQPYYHRMVYQSLKAERKENCELFEFVSLPQLYTGGIRGFYQQRDAMNKWLKASTWTRRYGKARRLRYFRGGDWHTHVPSFALKRLLTPSVKLDEEDKKVDLVYFDPNKVARSNEYSDYGETHRSITFGNVARVFGFERMSEFDELFTRN